jgi:exonuclease VII large subunit
MAITDDRDSVLKERSDLSQQLEGQNQRLEDLQLSVRRLGDENEKLLKTQEDLRRQIDYLSTSYGHRQANETQGNLDRQIHDLLDAHERGLAKVEQNVQSESIQPTKSTLIDASVYNPLGDCSQAGDVPGRPHSPALFVNNTPVTPGFLQSQIPAPKPAARKSKRSTRNPAPAYVDPPSPSTPKQSRKRKPASAGKDGPNKK